MPEHARVPLTIQAVQPAMPSTLAVTSPAINAAGWIDPIFSANGDNLSPALSWTLIPEAESFALVVEDPDAPRDEPFVHWLVWDIPGTAQGLDRDEVPEGAIEGRNDTGTYGWFGPRPPVGHGVHRYHFQIFALSKRLGMGPETPLKELLNALKGCTLASGEVVGLFETRDPVADAPSPARTGSYGETPSSERPTAAETAAGRGGIDEDDADRHAPHDPDGEVRRRGGQGEEQRPA